LRPDEAAAAYARVERLAEAVKRAGHPGRLARIRADVFVQLLDGRLTGLTQPQIVEALLADTADTDTDTDTADTDPEPRAGCGAHTAAGGAVGPGADAEPGAPAADAAGFRAEPGRGREAIEVRVGLPTLLGTDERPAELPGWGPVLPEVARRVVARQHGAEWRFAIVDDAGHLLQAGLTRRRPAGSRGDPHARDARGGIVELQVPARTLAHLAADPATCGGVGRRGRRPGRAAHRPPSPGPPPRRPVHPLRAAPTQPNPGPVVRGPGLPPPGSEVRRRPHDRPRHRGPTTAGNGGPLCRKDHRKKHRGGWQLTQPTPGRFHWTSPLGHIYRTRGEPLWAKLPEPVPADTAGGGGRKEQRSGTDPPPF
jgi:hypothetical protein